MIKYSVESDKIIQMMQDYTSQRTAMILKDLIDEHVKSEDTEKMRNGVKYYKVENTEISSKNFSQVNILGAEVNIPNAPNNKRKHPFFKIAIDQKVGYIDEPQLQSKTEKLDKQLTDVLGEDFPDTLNDWEKGASIKGVEYLHPYLNKQGEFDLVILSATQIIPVYDTQFQKELVLAIRYYDYEYKENHITKKLYKAEIYHDNVIEYWEQNKDGLFIHQETKPHFYFENTVTNIKAGQSWGKIPLIELQNNTEKQSDLYLAKDLVDDYDLHKSIFSNELESIQEVLLHIQGFDIQGTSAEEKATEWGELKRKILALKMIVTNDPEAKVEAIKQDIPHSAKDSHLDRTRKDIFMSLMAVDPQQVGDGNLTNIVLKARYMLLDMKAELLIAKLKKALRNLLYFVAKYSEYKNGLTTFDYKDIDISIGKNILINDAEKIQNLILSGDLISDETKTALHPYVDNFAEEMKRKEIEREAYQSQMVEDVE